MITVGGKAALFEVALAVFEEGQEVILPSPSWVSLPEQIQRMITGGDTENVPQRYRHLVEAYQKWLAEHAKGGTGR